jgi:hypothetical protein
MYLTIEAIENGLKLGKRLEGGRKNRKWTAEGFKYCQRPLLETAQTVPSATLMSGTRALPHL